MSSLRETIIKLNDRFINWFTNRPLRQEKDPQKRFEMKLWLDISGAFLGGQAKDGAWTNFKKYYYDKLQSEEEKRQVQSALLTMLKSNNYSMSKKAILAQVCADLQVKDALQDVSYLLQQAKDLSDKNILLLAYEALSRGITVRELVEEKFRKGERMGV